MLEAGGDAKRWTTAAEHHGRQVAEVAEVDRGAHEDRS
jgi:hypothetical protein